MISRRDHAWNLSNEDYRLLLSEAADLLPEWFVIGERLLELIWFIDPKREDYLVNELLEILSDDP